MKFKLVFEIECGEKTCASQKGNFCRFFRGLNSCYLFGSLFDKNGWVQRHEDCLRMAKIDLGPLYDKNCQ